MPGIKHNCDWCENKALFYYEVRKKKRFGLVPTGIRWYSCANHKHQLEAMAGEIEINQVE